MAVGQWFLTLWVVTPSQGSSKTIGKTQVFILVFITVAKLQLESFDEIILRLGVTTILEIVLKGHNIRKVENHCSRQSLID